MGPEGPRFPLKIARKRSRCGFTRNSFAASPTGAQRADFLRLRRSPPGCAA